MSTSESPPNRRQARSLKQIFGKPLVIGVLSTIGLISALVGDGLLDAASWFTLGVPIVLLVYFVFRSGNNRE